MEVGANLSSGGVVLHNLKNVMYKMTVEKLGANVTSMSAHGNRVFVGIAGSGIHVFRVENDAIRSDLQLYKNPSPKSSKKDCSCFEIQASPNYLIYIKEEMNKSELCVHSMTELLEGKTQPVMETQLARRAPLALEPQLKLVILGGAAWNKSWTGADVEPSKEVSEDSHLRVMSVESLSRVKEWKAVENNVSLLRTQSTADHSFLGVSDSQSGLKVYDLRQPTQSDYVCLYQIPVDEIRNFQLVGDFIAVFHKFEANVSFWNMKEHRTILCINIQDQMKHLAEEFLDDEEDDMGLFDDEDDHVTAVTSVPSDDDHVLIYGTKSGCIFGISVRNRCKLFNIPCPHDGVLESPSQKHDVQAITLVGQGKLVACYANFGFTMLDFSSKNPPDRPPTRSQRRTLSEGDAK